MPTTPFFPALRAQLAAQGQRTCAALRQLDFLPLCEKFRDLIPVHLLACEDEGCGSRERIFSLRLTLEGFVWQLLKPNTSCRDVVRAVQALFQAQGWSPVDENSSAYTQARLPQILVATAQIADRRSGSQGFIQGRVVMVADASTVLPTRTSRNTRKPPAKSPAAASLC